MHDEKVETAKKSINEVFSDTSVSLHETLYSLRDLKDELQMLIEAIESYIEQ